MVREVRTVVSLGGEGIEIGRMHVRNSWLRAGGVLFFKVGAGYTGVLT